MATKTDLITKAAEGALEDIKKYAPEEYAKLEADPAKMDELMEAARETAKETLMIGEEFAGESNDQLQDCEGRLAKHLSKDRIKLLKDGLSFPTFRMTIIRNDDGKYLAEFTRDGKEYHPTRQLSSQEDIDWATIEQYASILVEAVLLVSSAAGISLSPSASVVKKTVSTTAEEIRKSSALQAAMERFVADWAAAGKNPTKMATALFYLLKDTQSAGILMEIIKSLCSEMSWWDWTKTVAKVSAMLIAALASDGVALIAKIALVVMSAVDFGEKIINVMHLSVISRGL